jgi:hypothetical protein
VTRIQALSTGHAVDLQSTGAGAVHSVFARAVNLEVRGDLWTLLSDERADLPFGIRVGVDRVDALGLRRGDRVSVRSGFVGIGAARSALVVDCRAAPRWTPARQGERAPGLAVRLGVAATEASGRAWPGAAPMARTVVTALNDPDALGGALGRVVGCGPGSTPTGDDVLVGILAALTSAHSGAAGAAAAQSLCRSLGPLLSRTTEISAHLLRQAMCGFVARPVHELVCALVGASDVARLRAAVRSVLDMGATSGADQCTGLLTAATAFLMPHDERAAA